MQLQNGFLLTSLLQMSIFTSMVYSEFFGRHTEEILEGPVKISEIPETGFFADCPNFERRSGQQLCCMIQADAFQFIHDAAAAVFPVKSAESFRSQAQFYSHIFLGKFFLKILL